MWPESYSLCLTMLTAGGSTSFFGLLITFTYEAKMHCSVLFHFPLLRGIALGRLSTGNVPPTLWLFVLILMMWCVGVATTKWKLRESVNKYYLIAPFFVFICLGVGERGKGMVGEGIWCVGRGSFRFGLLI